MPHATHATFQWLAEAYTASSARCWTSFRTANSLGVELPGMPQRSISLLFEHVTVQCKHVERPLLHLAALFWLSRFAFVLK